MNKNKKYINFILSIFMINSLFSCLVTKTPNFNSALSTNAPDVSNYADYIIEDCELPDGRIIKAYVFDSVDDGAAMQNIQARKYINEFQTYKMNIFDFIQNDSPWKPTGPLSPYYKAEKYIYSKYGEKSYELLKSFSIISYYTIEDLGSLSQFMTKNSVAYGCYEDNNGVFRFTICPVKNLLQIQKNKEEQKKHEGQLAYEIVFIPKELYADKKLPNIQPAKTTPVNPNLIPDSDINLSPLIPGNNSKYYYDEILAYQLQWLSVRVACKGTYDMAYTGDFSAKNPYDYYKTSFIKSYLAKNDGKASKGTLLFEGICFDYADFAYNEFVNELNNYSNIANFYIVGTFDDYNDIIIYRLAKKGEKGNDVINRTPVVIYSHSHTCAHGKATKHAWFWVQTNDGTVYWIDPTWTDNLGYPVYGIVRGGKEIELKPDSNLCIN